ncbi:hypothetical protein DFH07DRAFT_845218 [Mycena maculata]|uniref:F-box domain-containing protein n=1 Tax=Mycena maculata TaxID=230809 RepID=A0AAD7MUS7_9AGAR|nr:hypothetical protein DFH07DRAFT_845218 [Mycena maculata]
MESESPFAQHLNTNYSPSDSEVKWIHSHLVPHVLEVSRLESLIRDLSAQRERTLAYIGAHRALLSPVRRMPLDIMQEIFLACLPTHRNAVMCAREAPLILIRICRAWKTLALSTPALWVSLHIPLQYLFYDSRHVEARKWLERSSRCPLSISIVGARDMEQWERNHPEEVDMAMETLSACSDRWRNLDLSFGFDEGMLRLGKVYAPNLVAVTINAEPWQTEQMELLTTPSLRSVALRTSPDFDNWILRLPLQWHHLTSLKLSEKNTLPMRGMSPLVALEILRRCPELINFEGDIIAFPNDLPPLSPQPTISLPAIREFVLRRCASAVGPASIGYLLQHLRMPQLRHLQLPRTGYLFHSVSPFLGDLGIQSPLIEDFSLDLAGLAQESLAENLLMLRCLNKLVVLDRTSGGPLDGEATPPRLFAFLASSTPPACPMLKELHVTECYSYGDADLLDFARKRLDHGGGHFTRLNVEYRRPSHPIAPEVLAPFIARGLNISTTFPHPARVSVCQRRETPWTGLKNL